jgi:hypothetical protein
MPKSVWWFEKLMWLSLLLGVVASWLDWGRIMSQVQAAEAGMQDVAKITALVTLVIVFGVMLLLIFLIARMRQNWARWVFTILFALGLPFTLMNIPATISADLAAGGLMLVQLVIQVVAVVMIFMPSSRPWFAKQPAAPAPV